MKKAELFNSFFADQYSLISNSSDLPSKLEYLTQSRLSSVSSSKADIIKLILKWRRGVVVITTAQFHSTKPELRFCAGSNPAWSMGEIRDDEDL